MSPCRPGACKRSIGLLASEPSGAWVSGDLALESHASLTSRTGPKPGPIGDAPNRVRSRGNYPDGGRAKRGCLRRAGSGYWGGPLASRIVAACTAPSPSTHRIRTVSPGAFVTTSAVSFDCVFTSFPSNEVTTSPA